MDMYYTFVNSGKTVWHNLYIYNPTEMDVDTDINPDVNMDINPDGNTDEMSRNSFPPR